LGLVRGDPVVLVAMFFGAAVLLLGGLYAMVPSVLSDPSAGSIALTAGLGLSLGFCMLVLGRIFWVVGRASNRARANRTSARK